MTFYKQVGQKLTPGVHGALAAALTVAWAFVAFPQLPHHDVPFSMDDHARWALDVAAARGLCGRSGYTPAVKRIAPFLSEHPWARSISIAEIATGIAGSVPAFCSDVKVPFVQNESSLQTLEAVILGTYRNASLVDIGRVFFGVQLAAISLFVFACGRAFSNAITAALLGALAVWSLTIVPVAHWYSIYTFFVPLLLCAVGCFVLLLDASRRHRLSPLLAWAVLAGAWLGFSGNMRTSHIPIYAMMAVLLCAAVWRRAGGRRALAIGSALLVGYGAYQYSAVTLTQAPHAVAGLNSLSYHVIAHPLVLGLALPPSDFSRRVGIEWNDDVGYALVQRLDPRAAYLSAEYESALFRFYRGLWKKYPREMLGVYAWKARIAGQDLLEKALRGDFKLPRIIRAALAMYDRLPYEGLGLLAVYALACAFGLLMFIWTDRTPWFIVCALSVIALLMQLESTIIVPSFSPSYSAYFLFVLPALWLVVPQAAVPFLWRLWRRRPLLRTEPAAVQGTKRL